MKTNFAKVADVIDKLDQKKRTAKDGSQRGVGPKSPGGQAELLLRSIDWRLREIIDKHTSWYKHDDGPYGGKKRVFTLKAIIAIAEEWKALPR